MKKIRAAVIGAGYLGRFHAQKYAAHGDVELVAVVDPSAERRQAVARELGCEALADIGSLLGRVEAVSVATPTPAHFNIAREFLLAGTHVLVEKPITVSAADARELIGLAEQQRVVLQVGHLERFNPAILAVDPHVSQPRFIESQRLAPFRERGTDVNVVLDLMIHDLDIVLSLVRSDIVALEAIGTAVFSPQIDIANARLRFANGCVANITASRVSLKTERKLRMFEDAAYLSLDLQQRILTLIRRRDGAPTADELPVAIEEQSFPAGDALAAEIDSFLRCIATGTAPLVGGADGLRALEAALRITELVQSGVSDRGPAR
ncbi:MAG: Gfo/Idh/MocA family oxidoreductase [Steroidobacteraceae bacterium]